MKHVPLLLAPLAMAAAYGCARAEAQTAHASSGGASSTGRGAIDLVVYAGDFAMVRETRRVDLVAGRSRIGLQDVSKALDQNSVLFDWPGSPGASGGKDAKVVSSAYDLGVGDSGRLLKRFLGREVELVYRGLDGKPGERVEGILEVADPGNVVVRSDGKYIVNPEATIEAPADQGIVAIPQLSAEVETGTGGTSDLRMTYMTGGLSWSADYTLTLAPDRDALGLECWATVTNRTGTDYPDAKISFVAGSPNRAVRPEADAWKNKADRDFAAAAPQSRTAEFLAPQAMGELYAYPYKSTATIRQDRMNRVRMMGSETIRAKRIYSIALPGASPWYAAFGANPDARMSATMGINFQNAKGDGLGLPLPAGAVRVYEPEKAGGMRYVGAATIGDTPKDARVSLELTSVFDVYARAKQTEAKRLDKKHTQRTIEVVVSNEKAKPVEVRLVVPFDGPWKIAQETAKSLRPNASSAEWRLNVPAGGETKLRYTAVFG